MATNPEITTTKCLVNGNWVTAASGRTFPVTDPATDEHLADVPDMGEGETRDAITAAHDAFPEWRSTPAPARAGLVANLANLMRRDEDRLAALMTAEQGKPLAESLGEIRYAASFFEEAARQGPSLTGDIVPASNPDQRILALRQPVGVCAIITPWNFPAAMITRKLGPALACGCTAIIKPAHATPLSALAIARLAIEAGLPPGTVNVLTADAETFSNTVLADERVRKLSFTGSTKVGQILMRGAADNLLRLSLELGGHAPFIVFDDADLDAAIEGAVACKFRNAGQTCICANRFFVQSGIYEAFMDRLARKIEALKIGRGSDDGVTIGPLINDDAVHKVEDHVADALDKGGKVLVGGERVKLEGLADRFYAPTLLEGMTPDMKLFREETFGPVAPVMKFDDEDEAVALANDSEFGLAAYFYTNNASRLTRVAEALDYGIVGANDGGPSAAQAPFGGVKHSGFGREGGSYAMHEYTDIKYVSVKIKPTD